MRARTRRRCRKPKSNRPTITSPVEAIQWVEDMASEDKEVVRVLFLDGRRRLICLEDISIGCATSCIVHPREIFCPAIEEGAVSIIVAHNHPSGDPSPSADDWAITRRITDAGELIGIKMDDHIIVGETEFVSTRENRRFPLPGKVQDPCICVDGPWGC